MALLQRLKVRVRADQSRRGGVTESGHGAAEPLGVTKQKKSEQQRRVVKMADLKRSCRNMKSFRDDVHRGQTKTFRQLHTNFNLR